MSRDPADRLRYPPGMPTPRDTPASDTARGADLPPSDALLRDDVRRLGALVGEILAEQVGPGFLAEVEALRVAAIARREAGAPVARLAAMLDDLPLDRAERLVRAFATYFGAINLAEPLVVATAARRSRAASNIPCAR